jgi:hypothetical protein
MRMKIHGSLLLILGLISGCQSNFGPEIGMTEKQWLRRTLIADVVYMEENVKAYRSSGVYYYFVDGVLAKIDQGMIPPHRIQMEVRTNQVRSTEVQLDKYDRLRQLDALLKDGVITEDEFQREKSKVLGE